MSEYEVIDNTNVRQFESEGDSTFEVIGDVKVREFTGGSSSGGSLPEVDSGDDGKSLVVEDGEWKSSDANLITGSGSGSIVSFDDALALPVKSLTVDINPVQSGSGDPSPENVRPISGWGEVNVYVAGKNLFSLGQNISETTISGVTFKPNEDGSLTLNGTATAGVNFNLTWGNFGYPLVGLPYAESDYPVTFSLQEVSGVAYVGIGYIDKSLGEHQFGSIRSGAKYTATMPKDALYLRVYIRVDSGTTLSNAIVKIQAEFGTEATEWVPSVGTAYPISLPQTVYGGVLDVKNGTLTVTKKMVDLASIGGTVDVSATGTTNKTVRIRNYSEEFIPSMELNASNVLCDTFSYVRSVVSNVTDPDSVAVGIYSYTNASTSTARNLYIVCGNEVENYGNLVLPLATPLTLSLTPTEVRTILGYNNVYASSGSVDVVYYKSLESVANQGKMYNMDSNNVITESRKLFADVLNGFSPSIKSSSSRVYHLCFVDVDNTNAYFMYMNFSATNTLKCQRVVVSNSGTVSLENEYTISVTPVSTATTNLSTPDSEN